MTRLEEMNGITPQTVYPSLVSKKIREKYSQNDVEALTSNYLENPEKYKTEWDEFQNYRLKCKEDARRELGVDIQ